MGGVGLFFAEPAAFRSQVRHVVRARRPRWGALQCEAVTDIDATADEMLRLLR
jgi:hypothetical protein